MLPTKPVPRLFEYRSLERCWSGSPLLGEFDVPLNCWVMMYRGCNVILGVGIGRGRKRREDFTGILCCFFRKWENYTENGLLCSWYCYLSTGVQWRKIVKNCLESGEMTLMGFFSRAMLASCLPCFVALVVEEIG